MNGDSRLGPNEPLYYQYSIYAWRPIKGTLENNLDPDPARHNAASDQDLHYLHEA